MRFTFGMFDFLSGKHCAQRVRKVSKFGHASSTSKLFNNYLVRIKGTIFTTVHLTALLASSPKN